MRRLLLPAVGLLCLVGAVIAASRRPHHPEELLVSAAASLTEAMKEIGAAYTRANPSVTVRFNFGASGALQRQIEQGAPVDVFASASDKEVDALQAKGLLAPGTRHDIAGNRLVLIVPAGSRLDGWNDLRGPEVKHIAISDPASVPSGRYAEETLARHGLWQSVKTKAVYAENVRQTLGYVATGEAGAGIVFATDARIEPKRVRIIAEADQPDDYRQIQYPAAALRDAPNAASARKFVQFLMSREAQDILRRRGFSPAPAVPARR